MSRGRQKVSFEGLLQEGGKKGTVLFNFNYKHWENRTVPFSFSGRTNALRALLKAEQDRGPDFLRLANALSALYPKTSEEKRLLDAMLLAVPRT